MTLVSPHPAPPVASGVAAWVDVCALDELDLDRGGAVLLGRTQVALFRLGDVGGREPAAAALYAVGNRDPFSGANVMARGIVGSAGSTVYVASPMYKQRFDLATGRCLDDEAVALPVWPVRTVGGRVEASVGDARA